ncbi:mannose-6-phosphate isomerase [Sphingomonas sinipercae]|uniref:Mannose-6-phosphate isomerase n=1 Tax=Sphingomonas sinipercae TaxID=2714944 RepID=A0A6G7ZKI2_9SPHN|nr:type I phosphomannose isomerase catalytic subunit [Sphingomonas sinipercae]QIL01443.1 mannose-6-phosphate isomerase [Sphingomonas sinipercae]
MECSKLDRRYVEKPWGRTQLPPMFGRDAAAAGERVGEVWFTGGKDLPLLAKYLFTSEALSVQVHPNDAQARQQGGERGKAECWYIIDAEPGAAIGLGFKRRVSAEQVREAVAEGSVEQLLDFRPVRKGDFIVVAPGTVHAIGAGIALLEFQQNSDLTYRLYDYGRPRDLHLDQALAVASLEPFAEPVRQARGGHTDVLADGPAFTVAVGPGDTLADRRRWILPLNGAVRCGDVIAKAGECLLAAPGARIEADDAQLLIGAEA